MPTKRTAAAAATASESDDDSPIVGVDGNLLDDQDEEDQEEELNAIFNPIEGEAYIDIGMRAARDCIAKGTRYKYYGILHQAGALCKFYSDNPLEPRPAHTEPGFKFEEHVHYADIVVDGTVPRPVPLALVKFFLGYCETKMVTWKYHANPLQKKHLSPGAINNVLTAVRDTYRMNQIDIDPAINRFCRNFMAMYSKMIGVEKNKSPPAFPVKSGASSISNAAASMLFKGACQMGTSSGRNRSWLLTRMLWPFLLICWSTLGRGERVGNLGYDMISWVGDALTIMIPTSKTDAQGMRSYGKRCYANPLVPQCCVVLALAVLVFSRSALDGPFQYVFSFNNTRNSMNDLLKILLASLSLSSLVALGCQIFEITLHTFKKSAMQFCTGGEGIKEMQLELRADHKINRTQSAYLKDTIAYSDQDGLIGRTLSQLPAGEVSFNMRAPHFLKSDMDSIEWRQLLPNYETLPDNFKGVVPFLVASLVYHAQWLRETLPSDHPIFRSKLFTVHGDACLLMKTVIHGGAIDDGDLQLTGKYMAGDACAFAKVAAEGIEAHRIDFKAFQQTPCGHVISSAAPVAVTSAPSVTNESLEASISKAVEAAFKVALETIKSSVPVAVSPSGPLPVALWPIHDAHVPKTFRIGAQTRADEAWRLYFNCPAPGDSPLRFVSCDNLPAGSQLSSQKVALSRLKKVCAAILGKTDPNVVARNSDLYFTACYKNFNAIMQFPDTWAVSYIYDQMHQPKNKNALQAALQSPAFDIANSAPIIPWTHMVATSVKHKEQPLQQQQLPEEFTVPCFQIRQMWDCWFHGNAQCPALKDIQKYAKVWKLYALDRKGRYRQNLTALLKCSAVVTALNPLGICDTCITSNSEQYFNEGWLRIKDDYPNTGVAVAMSTFYEKLIARKRKVNEEIACDVDGEVDEASSAHAAAAYVPIATRSKV